MKELTSGQFADLNCISKKTLRIYREMGLIKPVRVDEQTGYGFYEIGQCSTIDMIRQLQAVGMPLAQIKELADNGARGLARQLLERRDALDKQILDLLVARQNVTQLIDNCHFCHQDALYDVPIIEHLPARHILAYEILNPNSVTLDDNVGKFMDEWEYNLRLTKRRMLDEGIPQMLFHHVGCRIAKESLESRTFDLDASFIFIDEEQLAKRYSTETMPEGDYVTLYKRSYSENGSNAEIAGLNALLDYIDERGFKIAGDYYGIIVAETPVFHYEGREMLFRLAIPVKMM